MKNLSLRRRTGAPDTCLRRTANIPAALLAGLAMAMPAAADARRELRAMDPPGVTDRASGLPVSELALERETPGTADAALRAEPADAAAYARRGVLAAASRDFDQALADLDRACELAPGAADYRYQRALVHSQMNQRAEALQDVDAALKIDSADSRSLLLRARLRLAGRLRDGTYGDLKALDGALPSQSDLRREMALLYTQLGLTDLALVQWNQWIAAHPHEATLPEALSARCWSLAMLRVELDQARTDCRQAIAAQPANSEFIASRAWLHLRLDELDDAQQDFDRALALKPDGAWTLYGRGITRTRRGDDAGGRTDIAAARAQVPAIDQAAARFGLGATDAPSTLPIAPASPDEDETPASTQGNRGPSADLAQSH